MNCEKISSELIPYLQGRAGAAESRKVESHLAECAACTARAEEFKRLWTVLDEVPMAEPSLGFDARVRQRIAVEPRPSRWAWLVPAPRLVFATALLVALSVWMSSRPPVAPEGSSPTVRAEEEFRMIKDLPVLEDYDVISNFDALSELPTAQAQPQAQDDQKM